uniref:Uncharacterized protein n=1 Tax=Callorhinchus milii TaxID=7868 RepID=A0A4W3H2U4_CALMI
MFRSIEQEMIEQEFIQKQQQELNEAMQGIIQEQKNTLAQCEEEYLTRTRQLKRDRESVIWDVEGRLLQEKYHLFKQQVKDQLSLQRHQLKKRGEKEMERMCRDHNSQMEELRAQLAQERARLPKFQRQDGKTKLVSYKHSLKPRSLSTAEQRELVKQFLLQEEKRQKRERQQQQQQHEQHLRQRLRLCESN